MRKGRLCVLSQPYPVRTEPSCTTGTDRTVSSFTEQELLL